MAYQKSSLPIILISVILIAALGFLMVGGLREQTEKVERTTAPIALTPPDAIDPAHIVPLLERDSIQSIDEPQHEPVELADKHITPDERVIGVLINGEARAYPIPIMSSHEIVNDVVGGEPVAITWCPLCYTALVFSRKTDGWDQPLTFGVSGKLLYNTLVMFDRQTDTLWSQLYGVAIQGDLEGSSLKVFPSVHTAWGVWKSQHPDSLVLSKKLTCEHFGCGSYAESPRYNYEIDPYVSYYDSSQEGVIDAQLPREASILKAKKRVLGVRLSGEKRAYPFEVLTRQRIINDTLAGKPIVVWFEPDTGTGGAFLRQVDNRKLTFFADPNDLGILQDYETDTHWNAFTGEAVSGEYKGFLLSPVFVTTAFEFGWLNYFPDSDLYAQSP